jgi:hypothetical protein
MTVNVFWKIGKSRFDDFTYNLTPFLCKDLDIIIIDLYKYNKAVGREKMRY